MANRCKKCGQEFHSVSCPHYKRGLCRDCYAREFPAEYDKNEMDKATGSAFILCCFCPPLFLLFFPKKTCKVIGFFLKLIFNKWVLTILTCGFSWLLWKWLDKIYSK